MREVLKKIQEHPLITIVVLFAGIITFFATVWPTLSKDTIPEFLAKREWGITMPSWYYLLVIVLGCTVVVLQVIVIWAVWSSKKEQSPSPPNPQPQSPLTWLEALADEDSNQIVRRVIIIEESKKVTEHCDPTGSYVLLKVKLVNSSIYSLTLDTVENRITFWDTELPHQPEIYQSPPSDRPVTLNHGDAYQLTLRQWIPPNVVSHLEQVTGPTEFGVRHVAVRFTYVDRAGITRFARIRLGLPFFTKGHLAVSARS